MTTKIIINTQQWPPDGDTDCYCGLPAHSQCGLCSQNICTDHGRVHPFASQPPLCPPCLELMHASITAEAILQRLERLARQMDELLAAIAPVRGLHGHN